MRLALVTVCLLVVVAVTISPSSGNPAPGIKDRFTNAKEKIKELVDKTKIKESFQNIWSGIMGGLRGRRDVDFKNNGTYYSELSAISDLVSALQAASDEIPSSVEDVDKILEEGSVEDDVSDQDDSDEDEAAEHVDEGDVDDEKVDDAGEGGGENVGAEDVDNGDGESGSKERNQESNENDDEEEVQEEA